MLMFFPLLLPRGDDSTGDIAIPYATILSVLQRNYAIHGLTGEEMYGSIGGSGNIKPGSGGKGFSSTLAGGNTADNTFAMTLGGVGKRPMSTLSALVDMANNNTGACGCGKRFLSSYFAYRRPAESAVFRPRPPRMVKPAEAIASSCSRLLARLPRKV
jgi:hypothetical protein